MGKVFRLYDGGKDGDGWFDIEPYGSDVVAKIPDPSGLVNKVTSIPSPFARIDLVLSAFKHVQKEAGKKGRLGYLDGDTYFHKLVSDTLDVADIFFSNQNFDAKDMEVVTWDRKIHIEKLQNSSAKHKLLGDTLELYFEQDKIPLNLDLQDKFYLLKYKGEAIGGTSPTTLFFTSGNDLSWVGKELGRRGNDRYFDDEYCPLYKRDPFLIIYLASLFKKHPNLIADRDGKENALLSFSVYIGLNLERLKSYDPVTSEQVRLEVGTYYDELKDHVVKGNDNDPITVAGIKLKQRKEESLHVQEHSSFVLQRTIFKTNGLIPLGLQNGYSRNAKYVTDKWNPETEVPAKVVDSRGNKVAYGDRTLPGIQEKHPWVTVSDFLEERIIRLPYKIDSKYFFTGNAEGSNYLLPIKREFFKFYNSDQLLTETVGKSASKLEMFSMNEEGKEGVRVKLRLPIKDGQFVTFERLYLPIGSSASPDELASTGEVIEAELGLAISPFYRITGSPQDAANDNREKNAKDSLDLHYVLLTNASKTARMGGRNDTTLSFFDSEGKKIMRLVNEKEKDIEGVRVFQDSSGMSEIYSIDKAFDIVHFGTDETKGITIPKFKDIEPLSSRGTYHFAIDLGTTYTHVEYVVGDNKKPIEFNISEEESVFIPLHGMKRKVPLLPIAENFPVNIFFPRTIGGDSQFGFPQRSVLLERKDIQRGAQNLRSIVDMHLPLWYGTQPHGTYGSVSANIKWSAQTEKLRHFVENLIFLIRNKVIRNNGSLRGTTISYFYPTSMERGRVKQMKTIMEEAIARFLPGASINEPIPESLGPVKYYMQKEAKVSGERPVVGMDIGGGTVDLVVVGRDENTNKVTSFRFGGNFIMGDGYSEEGYGIKNALVKRFRKGIRDKMEEGGLDRLIATLDEIENTGRSNTIIDFLFSLKENAELRENNVTIDFAASIEKDEELRVVFVLYFGVLFYYMAKWMDALDKEIPKNIVLSGNGSKMIRFTDSIDLELISELAARIFKKVYMDEGKGDVQVKIDTLDPPKVITAKGGLLQDERRQKYEMSVWLGGSINGAMGNEESDKNTMLRTTETAAVLKANTDEEPNPAYKKLVETVPREALKAVEMLKEINKDFNLPNNFRLDPGTLTKAFGMLDEKSLKESLIAGLKMAHKSVGENYDDKIQESPFIYCFIQCFSDIAGSTGLKN